MIRRHHGSLCPTGTTRNLTSRFPFQLRGILQFIWLTSQLFNLSKFVTIGCVICVPCIRAVMSNVRSISYFITMFILLGNNFVYPRTLVHSVRSRAASLVNVQRFIAMRELNDLTANAVKNIIIKKANCTSITYDWRIRVKWSRFAALV